jgi:hypothetical protein
VGKQRYKFSSSYPQDERQVSDVLCVLTTALHAELQEPVHVGRNWVGLSAGLNYAEGESLLPVPKNESRIFDQPVV